MAGENTEDDLQFLRLSSVTARAHFGLGCRRKARSPSAEVGLISYGTQGSVKGDLTGDDNTRKEIVRELELDYEEDQ
jgi:hypothetical protein